MMFMILCRCGRQLDVPVPEDTNAKAFLAPCGKCGALYTVGGSWNSGVVGKDGLASVTVDLWPEPGYAGVVITVALRK